MRMDVYAVTYAFLQACWAPDLPPEPLDGCSASELAGLLRRDGRANTRSPGTACLDMSAAGCSRPVPVWFQLGTTKPLCFSSSNWFQLGRQPEPWSDFRPPARIPVRFSAACWIFRAPLPSAVSHPAEAVRFQQLVPTAVKRI